MQRVAAYAILAGYFLLSVGYAFKIPALVVAAVGAGGALAAPTWFGSLAVLLCRRSS